MRRSLHSEWDKPIVAWWQRWRRPEQSPLTGMHVCVSVCVYVSSSRSAVCVCVCVCVCVRALQSDLKLKLRSQLSGEPDCCQAELSRWQSQSFSDPEVGTDLARQTLWGWRNGRTTCQEKKKKVPRSEWWSLWDRFYPSFHRRVFNSEADLDLTNGRGICYSTFRASWQQPETIRK